MKPYQRGATTNAKNESEYTGVTKKKNSFYTLGTWNKMMDEMQKIKPTGAVKVVSGGKRVYNGVARILATLQEKQEAFEELTSMGVAVTENDREVLAPILSELEVCLTPKSTKSTSPESVLDSL